MKLGNSSNMTNKSQLVILNKKMPHLGEFSPGLAITSPFLYRPSVLDSYGPLAVELSNSGLQDIAERVANLTIPPSAVTMQPLPVSYANDGKSVAERLFDATAEVKMLTSQVAMHLENEWRERLFSQLDRLHDPDEWDKDDRPVERSSFSTFLKTICDLRPAVRPGLPGRGT